LGELLSFYCFLDSLAISDADANANANANTDTDAVD